MTDRTKEIKERRGKITPGPWDLERCSLEHDEFTYELRTIDTTGRHTLRTSFREADYDGEPMKAKFDAEFIAHAPEDIDFLISHIANCETKLAKARVALDFYSGITPHPDYPCITHRANEAVKDMDGGDRDE